MPVNFRHPEYLRNERRWRISRAVCEGEDAVKDLGGIGNASPHVFGVSPTSPTGADALTAALGGFAGTAAGAYGVSFEILPPLSGHTTYGSYWRYVQHAHFFPAASRAREGMAGMLSMDEAVVTAPAALDDFIKDVTSAGSPQTVDEFAGRVMFEVLTTGRAGILTDYPPRPVGPDGRPLPAPYQNQAEIQGIRPRWRMYTAEQIINWRMGRVRGRDMLMMVVLEESSDATAPGDDEFAWVPVRQWRVLDRATPPAAYADKIPDEAKAGDGMVCRVRFFAEDSEGRIGPGPDIWPMVNGKLSEEIPFEFVGARDCTPVCDKPPLWDVVTVNVGHYRNCAALEHGLFFCANPMAYVFGYDPEIENDGADVVAAPAGSQPTLRWKMGSAEMLVLRNANAKAGVISATAADLSALTARIDQKRDELAILVGRILATEKKVAEAAQTEQIRRQGERGILASLAANVGNALTRSLMRARDYLAAEGEALVTIPTDFWDAGLTATDATAIAELWFKYGILAKSDVRQQLRDAGFLKRTDKEIDDELALEPIPSIPPTPEDLPPGDTGTGTGAPTPPTPPAPKTT